MAGPEPQNLYGNFGGTPTEKSSVGGGGEPYKVQSSGGDFGAQVGAAKTQLGGAFEQTGQEASGLALKYGQMATEAKANEAIVNQWAPQAADLRQGYDNLRGQDKIAGYDSYIKSLQSGGTKFISDAGSPYEAQIRSSWVSRHISNEIDGAKREQVQAIQQFEDDAHAQKLLLHQDEATKNYDDPNVVNQNLQMGDAQILKHSIDQGADPNNPVDKAIIESHQKDFRGTAAVGMVGKAIADGNVDKAAEIYDQSKQDIPGYQQTFIDKTLHVASVAQTSDNNTNAILSGMVMADGVGKAPVAVHVAVAQAAGAVGIDTNHALTVARIESNYGQNVGKRGDIGQTGKPGSIPEQATNMATELKKSETVADNALGRKSEPWEQYLCYQQGAGGGPALMKAATDSPNARAVDVLKPLYKTPQDAMNAVTNNGGNVTMTSGQFMDFIKQKYQNNADAARCEVPSSLPQGTSIAQAITNQHTTDGPALQKGSNPKEDLVNFDKNYNDAMARAQNIVNVDERNGTIQALNRRRSAYSDRAAAYDTVLNKQLDDIIKDPKFTDVGALPPELVSSISPQKLNYAERVAENHLNSSSGVSTKDMKEYGPGMYDLMRDVSAGKIKSPDELLSHLPDPKNGKQGDITLAGYKQLQGMFSHDPDSESDKVMQAQAFKVIKRDLSGEDEMLGIKDPKGEENFSKALPKLFKAIEEGKKQEPPLTMGEMTDPDNPHWIGNAVKGLKRSIVQQNMDMIHGLDGAGGSATKRTANDIIKEYQSATDPSKKAALEKEGIDLGYFRKRDAKPEAPISQ